MKLTSSFHLLNPNANIHIILKQQTFFIFSLKKDQTILPPYSPKTISLSLSCPKRLIGAYPLVYERSKKISRLNYPTSLNQYQHRKNVAKYLQIFQICFENLSENIFENPAYPRNIKGIVFISLNKTRMTASKKGNLNKLYYNKQDS